MGTSWCPSSVTHCRQELDASPQAAGADDRRCRVCKLLAVSATPRCCCRVRLALRARIVVPGCRPVRWHRSCRLNQKSFPIFLGDVARGRAPAGHSFPPQIRSGAIVKPITWVADGGCLAASPCRPQARWRHVFSVPSASWRSHLRRRFIEQEACPTGILHQWRRLIGSCSSARFTFGVGHLGLSHRVSRRQPRRTADPGRCKLI